MTDEGWNQKLLKRAKLTGPQGLNLNNMVLLAAAPYLDWNIMCLVKIKSTVLHSTERKCWCLLTMISRTHVQIAWHPTCQTRGLMLLWQKSFNNHDILSQRIWKQAGTVCWLAVVLSELSLPFLCRGNFFTSGNGVEMFARDLLMLNFVNFCIPVSWIP